jgi:serine protease Do
MRVSPAIVQIDVLGYRRPSDDDRGDETQKSEADVVTETNTTGSGVILEADGYIITNAHVVEGARRVRVSIDERMQTPLEANLPRGRTFEARVVGKFEEADLALLKIDAKGLPTIRLADSDTIQPGALVFSIGNPEGLKNTVGMGIVSSISRTNDAERPAAYIQTDAPINAGSSGGALVDINGKLVGITSFIVSESGGNEGLGFALPSNLVQLIYHELKTQGYVRTGDIGVKVQTITSTLAAGLGLSQDWGVVVSDVEPNSPAANAGLHVQDVLVTLDGTPIGALPQFTASFYTMRAGDHVSLEVLRGARRLTFDLPVLEKNEEPDDPIDSISNQSSPIAELGILCISLKERPRAENSELRSDSGVVVLAKLAHPTLRTSLAAGDLIRSVNGTRVLTVKGLQSALEKFKSGDPVVLQIERRRHLKYVAFEMD